MNVLTASGSSETIDQSASRLIDDVMTSTNEISWTEEEKKLKWTVICSFENIFDFSVTKSPLVDFEKSVNIVLIVRSDYREWRWREESCWSWTIGSKWSCRQSDERHLTVDLPSSYRRLSMGDWWRRSSVHITTFVHVKDRLRVTNCEQSKSATTTRSSWSSVDRQTRSTSFVRQDHSYADLSCKLASHNSSIA